MTDTAPIMEAEESVFSFSTLVLALITLAVYLLFLKPTGETENNNAATNTNTNAANTTRTRERQRPRGGRRVATPQQQQQQQPLATRRRQQPISENALEVLSTCQSLPPHVAFKSQSIGGFESLSENGLVQFSHTKIASQKVVIDNNADAKLQQRKERAKILSRLFSSKDFGKALPAPPSKGSTFVVGISKQTHLVDGTQKSSLVRVLKGLSSHYTVLVVVSLDSSAQSSSSSSYEPTHKLHSEVVNLLRNDDDALPESTLPSHRILLAGSAKGRVALVRQLSTNIGLTVDFDRDVKDELERFGYDVSIVEDWKTILPAETL